MSVDVITLPRRTPAMAPPKTPCPGRRRAALPRWREGVVLFCVFAVFYLAVAWLMVRQNIIFPDALSRVANA